MNYISISFLIIVGMCYGSSAFFILTASNQEVKSYCRQDTMDNESKYSQRNVTCKLRKYRK